jgi:MFS family permease
MSFTNPRWRDVYVAAGARAIDQGGTVLAAVTLQITLQQRGHGGLEVAGLLLAAAIPPMLLASVAGRVVDRFDSRAILLIAGPVQMLTALALAFTTSLPAILALVAALSAGAAFTQPTFSALTPAMVGRENLVRASGLIQSASFVGMLAGPALAGLLVGAFGARVPLLMDAASFVAVPVAALLIKTRRGPAHPVAEPDPVGTDANWTIWRDPVARPVVLLFALVIAALTVSDVVEVFLVLGPLHSTATAFGVISTLWVVGLLVGSALTRRIELGDFGFARLLVLLLAGTCLVQVLGGSVPAVGWMLPLWLFGGLTNGGENVLAGVLVVRRSPEARRGRASATFSGVMNAATTAGYGAGGLLMAATGSARAVMIGAGTLGLAVCLLLGLPILLAARREREGERAGGRISEQSIGPAAGGPLPSVAGHG